MNTLNKLYSVFYDKLWYMVFTHNNAFRYVPRVHHDSWITFPQAFVNDVIFGEATHIIDNIYLGSAFNAADHEWLEEKGITCIVNVTKEISNFYPDEFTYHRYGVDDLLGSRIGNYYDSFLDICDSHAQSNILVHCFAGRSRSASLVVYYLVKRHDMSLLNAISFVRQRRSIVNMNIDFVNEIEKCI